MASGWAKDGAVQEQIDSTVADAVLESRRQLEVGGMSLTHCEECGEAIPERRREIVPGVRHCVHCQALKDAEKQKFSPFNRRGSKDSQLR